MNKNLLHTVIKSLSNGDKAAAQEAFSKYISTKAKIMLNESWSDYDDDYDSADRYDNDPEWNDTEKLNDVFKFELDGYKIEVRYKATQRVITHNDPGDRYSPPNNDIAFYGPIEFVNGDTITDILVDGIPLVDSNTTDSVDFDKKVDASDFTSGGNIEYVMQKVNSAIEANIESAVDEGYVKEANIVKDIVARKGFIENIIKTFGKHLQSREHQHA